VNERRAIFWLTLFAVAFVALYVATSVPAEWLAPIEAQP
jgi:hypothetical protein